MKKILALISVKIFQWLGQKLFSDRIDYYKDDQFQGVAFSSNPNLIAQFRMNKINLNNNH